MSTRSFPLALLLLFAGPAAAQGPASGGPALPARDVPKQQLLAGSSYIHDIGSSLDSWGGGVATTCWIHAFTATGGVDSISQISAAYGSPTFPTLPDGLPVQVLLYDDPNNDGDPTDAVLLWNQSSVTVQSNTDTFIDYPVSPPVQVTGGFFIAVACEHTTNHYPAAMDQSQMSLGRAWMCRSNGLGVTFDINNLAANDFPPAEMDLLFPSGTVWMLRADGQDVIGSSYCTSAANSISASGSSILAIGSTSLANMDVSLSADNAPSQPALFYFGPAQTNLVFGNGFRCVGGSVTRMPVVFGAGGSFAYDVDFGVYGGAIGGLGTVNFQCWYRDPAGGGAAFNLSDGVEIIFAP